MNALQKVKRKYEEASEDATQFMAEQMVNAILPHIKKLIPMAERNFKDYLGEQEKMIVITRLPSGDIGVMIMNQQKMDLKPKEGEQPEGVIISTITFSEMMTDLMSGNLK